MSAVKRVKVNKEGRENLRCLRKRQACIANNKAHKKGEQMKVTELDRRNVKVTRTETRYILTEKVFQLDCCPDWAQYAAVDEDGHAYYFEHKPHQYSASWRNAASCSSPCLNSVSHIHTDTPFDATDWQHSLIRRPQKVLEVTMADLEKKFGCKVKIVKEL